MKVGFSLNARVSYTETAHKRKAFSLVESNGPSPPPSKKNEVASAKSHFWIIFLRITNARTHERAVSPKTLLGEHRCLKPEGPPGLSGPLIQDGGVGHPGLRPRQPPRRFAYNVVEDLIKNILHICWGSWVWTAPCIMDSLGLRPRPPPFAWNLRRRGAPVAGAAEAFFRFPWTRRLGNSPVVATRNEGDMKLSPITTTFGEIGCLVVIFPKWFCFL